MRRSQSRSRSRKNPRQRLGSLRAFAPLYCPCADKGRLRHDVLQNHSRIVLALIPSHRQVIPRAQAHSGVLVLALTSSDAIGCYTRSLSWRGTRASRTPRLCSTCLWPRTSRKCRALSAGTFNGFRSGYFPAPEVSLDLRCSNRNEEKNKATPGGSSLPLSQTATSW